MTTPRQLTQQAKTGALALRFTRMEEEIKRYGRKMQVMEDDLRVTSEMLALLMHLALERDLERWRTTMHIVAELGLTHAESSRKILYAKRLK